MALFGGQRDISLFRTLNRELINEIIDTEVDIFKAAQKEGFRPMRVSALRKVAKGIISIEEANRVATD